MRVAYTLEQLWHRVPGGTAVAAVETERQLRGLDGLELVGVSAWHRRLPEPPWRPPISVRRLPVPPHVLYETWHGLRRPHVERATGMRWVVLRGFAGKYRRAARLRWETGPEARLVDAS